MQFQLSSGKPTHDTPHTTNNPCIFCLQKDWEPVAMRF